MEHTLANLKNNIMHLPTSVNEIGRVRVLDIFQLVDKLDDAVNNKHNYLEINANDGGVEITIENEAVSLSHIDTKQSLINDLIAAGVLTEGEVVQSRDE